MNTQAEQSPIVDLVVFTITGKPEAAEYVNEIFYSMFKDTIYTKGSTSVLTVDKGKAYQKTLEMVDNMRKSKEAKVLSTTFGGLLRALDEKISSCDMINEQIKKIKNQSLDGHNNFFDASSYEMEYRLAHILKYDKQNNDIEGIAFRVPTLKNAYDHEWIFVCKNYEDVYEPDNTTGFGAIFRNYNISTDPNQNFEEFFREIKVEFSNEKH